MSNRVGIGRKKKIYSLRRGARRAARDAAKFLLLLPSGITRRTPPVYEAGRQKRLVILKPDGIGDFILLARSLGRFRSVYERPEWEITLVGNAVYEKLALTWNEALNSSWFDRFVPVDKGKLYSSFSYRRELASSLNQLGCDELIYPVVSRDVAGCIMAGWINAVRRSAPSGDTWNMTLPAKKFFDRRFAIYRIEQSDRDTELALNERFQSALGVSGISTPLPFPVTASMTAEAAALFQKLRVDSSRPYVVLCPGSTDRGKCWPATKFIRYGRALPRSIQVFVSGNSAERVLCEEIAEGIGGGAISVAGECSLVGLAGIIAGAQHCISNDSAAAHIAAAFQKPVLCILGGGVWERFWPYDDRARNQTACYPMPCFGCGWDCLYALAEESPYPCVELVDIDPAATAAHFDNLS